MATDDERREVAQRLRELPDDSTYPDLIGAIADRDGWYPAADAADRLADLIEPSCDRDALLEEVKELEKCAWYFGLDFDEDEPLRDRLEEASEAFAGSANRIREALGVEQ